MLFIEIDTIFVPKKYISQKNRTHMVLSTSVVLVLGELSAS